MKRTYFNIIALVTVCAVTQMQAMTMETARTSKKENSSSQTCCCIAKALCGLAAGYCVMTSSQPANAPQLVIIPVGQPQARVEPTVTVVHVASCSYKLEPGYAATSWNDLLNVRNRKQYEQTACTMDDDEERNDVLEKYKDYII